jgi:Translocation protein Sec62
MIPKPRGKLALFLLIGFIIAIAFMLFNLWPMWLKIGIWYVSFYLLIFLMGFILLRLIVWLFLFHFGVDFWILPNFFIDSNDLMDSFRPLLSFERRQDDMKMILMRVGSAIALIFFVIQLAKEPDNLEGLRSFADDSMTDLFNWGNDKFVLGRQIADHSGNSTVKRKKTPQEIFMEAILDEEEQPPKQEEPVKTEETTKEEKNEDKEDNIDRDTIGGTDEEEEKKDSL